MRLLWKILLLSIAAAVIPLSVAGWNIISRIQDELVYSAVSTKLEGTASELAYRIDQMYVREWNNILHTVAKTEQLALFGGNMSPDVPLEAAVEEHDDLIVLQFYPSVRSQNIHIVTMRGSVDEEIKIRAEGRDRAEILAPLLTENQGEALEAARDGGTFLGNPFTFSPLGGLILTMSVPWEPPKATANGAVVAKVSLERLQSEVVQAQFGAAGLVYIIDRQGKPIAHPDTTLLDGTGTLVGSAAADRMIAMLADKAVDVTHLGGPPAVPMTLSTEMIDGNGVEWRVAYAVCATVPWGVVVQEPLEDALAPVRAIVSDLMLWLLLGLAMGILGGLVLSRMIGRPVKLLAEGARAIGEGKFHHRLDLRSHDELGELAEMFNHMAEQLLAYNEINVENLIREKAKGEAILHNIADGVIVTGIDGEILIVNSAAERWFRVVEEQVLKQPLNSCISVVGLAELINDTQGDRSKEVHSRELVVELPGQIRPTILNAHAARVETERGELFGITTVLRDVTAEREVDRMKTELVSVVAHELRSPLVSIMGFSGILLEEDLDMNTRLEFAKIINDESNRMVEMINKFLDISRIESGKTEVVRVPTDLVELVAQIVDINRGQADAKDMKVNVNTPQRATSVTVDPDLIGQAILNLFTNAVKYSPPGSEVDVVLTEHRDDLQVAIVDRGYGISLDGQKRLFEKFYRVDDNPLVRDIGGTGLGLSLTREIVEQHNGRVEVQSALGDGSTFSIFLPKRWT
jgi:two-component system, OmpR family, sensor histidine kinase VicK